MPSYSTIVIVKYTAVVVVQVKYKYVDGVYIKPLNYFKHQKYPGKKTNIKSLISLLYTWYLEISGK